MGLGVTQGFKHKKVFHNFKVALTLLLTGCLANQGGDGNRLTNTRDDAFNNTPGSVSAYHGRVLLSNPVAQTGNRALTRGSALNPYLSGEVFITSNASLVDSCTQTDPITLIDQTIPLCHLTLEKKGSLPLEPIESRWAFAPSTYDFLQVQTFYHTSKALETYFEFLSHTYSSASPAAPSYSTAIPSDLYTDSAFWYDGKTLINYAACESLANAYFEPTTFSLCYGVDPNISNFAFAQDPSVIYHEMGHVLTKLFLNQRNMTSSAPTISSTLRADLGVGFYDEAGALNEGIADYFSHVMTDRTHFGEWALQDFSRPIGEEDEIHAPGINETSEGRLAYPEFIDFDAIARIPIEDIHLTGQIASHFFKELQDQFVEQCSFEKANAKKNVIYLINETLAYLGDLSARGSDINTASTYHVNLLPANPDGYDNFTAFRWGHFINPPTMRSFFQTFGRFFLNIFGTGVACNGSPFDKDVFESLLDDYGLLLFKSYNDNGNGYNSGTETGHIGTPTQVNPFNRIKSVLIPKELIKLDPTQNAVQGFVFDQREDLINVITSLKFAGSKVNISSQLNEDLIYNNGNGRFSPGEIVGLALNLYNDSNSTMGGIQVLANDWDQAKLASGTSSTLEPCNNFADEWPLSSEGAADRSTETASQSAGDCNHITKVNGPDATNGSATEFLAPVCWVQMRSNNETKWVDQNTYRKEAMNLDSNYCLEQNDRYHNCLLNAIEGADHAFYSRIDSKKTWSDSLSVRSSSSPEQEDIILSSAQFSPSNLILFEVNPYITPGTVFNCRFRVRFTNCSDCWGDPTRSDNDDFLDYEYAGGDPYQIIHLQFTVVD